MEKIPHEKQKLIHLEAISTTLERILEVLKEIRDNSLKNDVKSKIASSFEDYEIVINMGKEEDKPQQQLRGSNASISIDTDSNSDVINIEDIDLQEFTIE